LGLQLASIAYSLSDPLLLVASGFGRGSIARAWWFVVYGTTCFIFANQAYRSLVFHELHASGSLIDAFWPLAFGLIPRGALRWPAAHAKDC
jgi:hypothetical protein